jgi:hypothetical protein
MAKLFRRACISAGFLFYIFKPSMKSLEIGSTNKAWKADSELLLLTSAGTENLVGG